MEKSDFKTENDKWWMKINMDETKSRIIEAKENHL